MDGIWLYDTADFEADPEPIPFFAMINKDAPRAVNAAFSPDGAVLATADGKGQVELWDVAALESRQRLTGGVPVLPVFSPDGLLLASLEKSQLQLWDVAAGEKGRSFPAPRTSGALFTLDSQQFITYGCGVEENGGCAFGHITVRAVADGALLLALEDQPGWIVYAALLPDGETLIAASQNGVIWRWDITSGTGSALIEDAPDGAVLTGFSLTPDGTRLALGFRDGTIRLIDPTSGAEISAIHQDSAVNRLAFSPDGTMLASGAKYGALIWDTAAGETVTFLQIIH
jgi:WD40 repeat protein